MSREWEKTAIEAALKSRSGMSEDKKVQLVAFNEKADDWYGTCRKCGEKVRGTLAKMREHICDAKA